ncbi:hypothetical protein [Rhodococcoides yunnanense]|uniref:hypothetical protein n=1 Tax=Rhodococcoides yunnanense TaxID=278209 RepID=UPI000AD3107A|nr:hypothetical protein [Rhodococcus yunnanensis]
MGSKGPASRGQKRAAKTKARQRRQQSSTGSHLPTFPAGVLEDFGAWLTDRDLGRHAERVVGLVRTTLTQIDRANPGFSVTSWTPNDAHFIVDAVERIEDSDEENGAAAATNIVVTLLEFLTFLDETDRWTGTDEDFSHCMEDLTDFIDSDPDVLDPEDVELPEIAIEAESAALLALPLVVGVDALVERVGAGIPVAGVEELSTALDDHDHDADHDHDHDPSPADLASLDQWAAAIASDVLQVEGTDVVPGPSADSYRSRSVDTLREVLTQHIRHQLSLSEEDVSMALSNSFAIQTLLAAMTEDLPLDNPEEDYDGLEGEDLRTAQLIDYRVRALQEQGVLVRVDDSLEVPPALRRAVLAGVERAEPFGDWDDDGDEDGIEDGDDAAPPPVFA